MLSAAGNAINALTNAPLPAAASGDDLTMEDDDQTHKATATTQEHRAAFEKSTRAYFTSVQAILARLRRQAYALEEAGIITAQAPTLSTTSTLNPAAPAVPFGQGAGVRRAPGPAQKQEAVQEEQITNGGLGNLDVGWLNSRGNRVGEEKEAELIKEAREMLDEVLEQRKSQGRD